LKVSVPDTALAPVIADRSHVHQVRSNLLANAARYTPAGGHITVGLVDTADGIEIVVKDTGYGIAAEDLANIFQPFTRGGCPRRDDGLGLGLWLAREIAVLHGGTLHAESNGPGTAATFRFRLPRRVARGARERPHVTKPAE
jgi:diguanylate cyclase